MDTFQIPTENLSKLEERIAKLNKTAEKLDVEPITIEKGEPIQERHRHNGVEVFTEVTPVTVHGKAPKLEGWTFAATLEHSEGGTVLRRVPGSEADLSNFREANPDGCDQCGYKRRRKNTYVVEHDEGTLKQVGSNCLKDFLGHASPQKHARYAEYLRDLMEELNSGGYREMREPALFGAAEYLAEVAYYIREQGWVSRSDAWARFGDQAASTASVAQINFFNRLKQANHVSPTDQDRMVAAKALEWAQNLDAPDNDYLHNLHTVLKPGTIRSSQFGIAASAIVAYQNAERKKTTRQDEFVGEQGDRFEATLSIVQVYDNPSVNWGMIHKHIMRDDQGRTLVWPATNGTKLETGQSYQIKGTVREHEETKYGKQTVLTRCKVIEA